MRDGEKSDNNPGENRHAQHGKGSRMSPTSRPSVQESPMAKHSLIFSRQGKLSFAECPAAGPAQPDSAVQPQPKPAKPKISLQELLCWNLAFALQSLAAQSARSRIPQADLNQGQPARVGQGCLSHVHAHQTLWVPTSVGDSAARCQQCQHAHGACAVQVSRVLCSQHSSTCRCPTSSGLSSVPLESQQGAELPSLCKVCDFGAATEPCATRDLFLVPVTKCKRLPSVQAARCKQTTLGSHLVSSSGSAGTPFCTVSPWAGTVTGWVSLASPLCTVGAERGSSALSC